MRIPVCLEMERVNADVVKLLPIDPKRVVFSESYDLHVVGSCNGLCCFIEFMSKSLNVRVCNPVTGEYVDIPTQNFPQFSKSAYGFGFCASTGMYKVVRIERIFNQCNSIICDERFTLVGQKRRNFNVSSFPEIGVIYRSVYINGVIHWFGLHYNKFVTIYGLNVEEEKDRCFSLPASVERWEFYGQLVVLNDHLCVIKATVSQIDIWVMEEYGVVESWTKYIVIKDDPLSSFFSMDIVTLLKDERILFRIPYESDLFAYDRKKRHLIELRAVFRVNISHMSDLFANNKKEKKLDRIALNLPGEHFTYVPDFSALGDIIAKDAINEPSQNSSSGHEQI